MDREKEIEEIVSILCEAHHKLDVGWTNHFIDGAKFPKPKGEDQTLAETLYNAGYRKIVKTDWLTRGISKEQLEKEKDESLKEFFEGNCKKYGYRKQSEVAREIFAEIEDSMSCFEDDDDGYLLKKCEFKFFMRELKKKYTEESENDR